MTILWYINLGIYVWLFVSKFSHSHLTDWLQIRWRHCCGRCISPTMHPPSPAVMKTLWHGNAFRIIRGFPLQMASAVTDGFPSHKVPALVFWLFSFNNLFNKHYSCMWFKTPHYGKFFQDPFWPFYVINLFREAYTIILQFNHFPELKRRR